jgi:hypothetical protein
MNKDIIVMTRLRIERLKGQLLNEQKRVKAAAESAAYEKNIDLIHTKIADLLNQLYWLEKNELSIFERFGLWVQGYFFCFNEWFRKHREKKALIASDKQHIKNILVREADRPGDFYFDVDIKQLENDKAELVGERKIIIENHKTAIRKVYEAGSRASNDWSIQLTHDLERGRFKKQGSLCH